MGRTEPVTVPVKDVLRIIQFHAAGEHDQVKALAYKLAEDLSKEGHDQLADYIFIQYNPSAGWVPMGVDKTTPEEV